MSAINSVFSWFMKKRFHQIELFMKYPIEVQNEVLDDLLRSAEKTKWGKHYRYSEIKSSATYRERVPLQTYEDLKPYVQRLKEGEQNLLWSSDIQWFAKSSGTTSDRSKFIPVSKESLEDCHYKGGKDLLAIYNHNHPNNGVYEGKSLVLGGSSQINSFRKDSYYGDLSSIIINNLPFWAEIRRIPEKHIALMDGWENKIEAMAQNIKHEDVTNMVGVPSWTLVLLRRVLEITGKNDISEVWPNLQLYMHGGVNFGPYEAQFKSIINLPHTRYYETYNASEGFFGLQDTANGHDLLLLLDYGIYYEFIDFALSHLDQPPTKTLEEVEVGKNYELVISTNAGLWRYRIGDTVEFTSLFPFKIKVTGRTKHFINAFGEELIIDNAENALAEACMKANCSINEYTAGPVYMSEQSSSGGHEWLIEFERAPADMTLFVSTLDTALRNLNSDYDAKRTGNLNLRSPIIKTMPKNSFHSWLKSKGKLGGQHKVPRLSNNRDIIEELLENVEAAYSG
jgi:hypothetical protein